MYTFAQPLTRALTAAPGACAGVCQDSRRTFAELGARCRRLASAMRALGLAPGDRVGVIALNSGRYLKLYLGLPAAGYQAIGLETMCIGGGQGMAMIVERLSRPPAATRASRSRAVNSTGAARLRTRRSPVRRSPVRRSPPR